MAVVIWRGRCVGASRHQFSTSHVPHVIRSGCCFCPLWSLVLTQRKWISGRILSYSLFAFLASPSAPMVLGRRIPLELQNVFVASNKGEEVHQAPDSAFKVFRNFMGGMKRMRFRRFKTPRSPVSVHSYTSFHGESHSVASDPEEESEQLKIHSPSPQDWVEDILLCRGYFTDKHSAVHSAYFNSPTKLQLASYNGKLIELCVTGEDNDALREVLTCGVSANACNIHGETLMHKVCRLGRRHEVLQVFIEAGAELKICDAQGRTLLHDACWGSQPCFDTFTVLIEQDPELLFMKDCRGSCPLDYVQKTHRSAWIEFLQHNLERFWPPLAEFPTESDLVSGAPNSRPVPDPVNALSCELASMVTSGRLKPTEAIILMTDPDDESDDDMTGDISDDNYTCSSREDTDDSSGSSVSSYDSELMEALGLI